jgi:hypothetical protein
LGSNAVDSVKGDKSNGKQQPYPPPYYGYMAQPLPPMPYHPTGEGYRNTMQPYPTENVFNNVLGQDIATFLHGERIASQTNPYWNPYVPMWQQQPYPHSQMCEPPPPPLTPVPHMELRRVRLPSISDDDWADELENDAEKKTPPREERRQPPMYAPPPPFYNPMGYYPPMTHYRNENAHEKSSLIDPSRTYNHYNDRRHKKDKERNNHRPKDKEQRRRKKKKSRRRDKSRLPESSEDESERRGSRKSRRYNRRHRKTDDTLSDATESMTQTSFATAKVVQGGVCRRWGISFRLGVCNLPLSGGAVSFSIVLLGTLWFQWAEEILSSCKEVTFHSSQCSLPEFPGECLRGTLDHLFTSRSRNK